MLKNYLKDIAFIQVLNLLVKPIWILIIDASVQEKLPQEVYGNYAALVNFTLIFFIVLDLGLTSYNTTHLSRDNQKIKDLFLPILGGKLLLIAAYVAVVVIVGNILGYNSSEFKLIGLLTLVQVFTSFNQYFRSVVSSFQKFKLDGVFMVLDRVILIILSAILIWGSIEAFPLTIDNFVWAQIIGLGSVTAILVIYLFPYFKSSKLRMDVSILRDLLKKSWPFALLIALMGTYNYVDSVMLKDMVGNTEAGEYALGYRLFYAVLMFAQIFSGVLLPFFSKNLKDQQVVNTIAIYTSKFLILVGCILAFGSLVYHEEIIGFIYPEKFNSHNANSFSILMFGFLGSGLILVYGTLLTAMRELKSLNIIGGATLVFNLIANYLLIPRYGATGAAFATILSQLMFGLACYVLVYKKNNLPANLKARIIQLTSIVLLGLVIIHIQQYVHSIAVHMAMIFLTSIVVAYLFKLFEKRHLTTLFSKKRV